MSSVDCNLSFANQTFSRKYDTTALFGVKFYDMNELIAQSKITLSDNKTLHALLMFDANKQKDKLTTSVVDVQLKTVFTENVPANTEAFTPAVSGKMLSFQSDGNKNIAIY